MQRKVWKMLEYMLRNIRMKPEENAQNAEHLTTRLKGYHQRCTHQNVSFKK
jgi:hypothetical protein